MQVDKIEKKDHVLTKVQPSVRHLKIYPVYRENKYEYVKTAEIRLSGKWLERLGFLQGQRVKVITRQGLLIVRPVSENTA